MIALNFLSADGVVLSIGDDAPPFSLNDQDGNIRNLHDYKGKRTVVYFFPIADTPG
jgi:peroxiredoxin Q/BCP